MKKIAAVLLLLVYSVSVSGAAFHLHFCGSYLQSISLAGTDHEGCCCGKKVMDKNCCKDKEVVLKTKDDTHHASLYTAIPKIDLSFPILFIEPLFYSTNFVKRNNNWVFHSPPKRPKGNELNVLNCVLRI